MKIEKGKMYRGPDKGSLSLRKVHDISMNRGLDRTRDRAMFYIVDPFGVSLFDPPVMAACYVTAFEGWTEVDPLPFSGSDTIEQTVDHHRDQAISIMCRLLDISEFTVEDSDRAEDVRLFVDNMIAAAKEIK